MAYFQIAASILSANLACLGEEVKQVLKAGADRIHIDVMDNHYVPNLTFGPLICRSLRRYGITAPIDVHLMVKPVDSLIVSFAEAGADLISFHPEASEHVHRSITLIKSKGCQAGLVFNPATPLSYLDYILEQLDLILLMSVNPGFGGQEFISASLDKIRQVNDIIKDKSLPVRLEVDGGIKIDNIAKVAHAGADSFVVGSALFNTSDYAATLRAFRTQLDDLD
jgi:ribulose-phosphate 3-epimerase